MAGVAGLEPTLTVLETVALPLNYTPPENRTTLLVYLRSRWLVNGNIAF